MEQLHNYVIELLPGATQSEVFGGRVIYKVPKEGVGALSVIFTKLEKGMVYILEDWLGLIAFINFAKMEGGCLEYQEPSTVARQPQIKYGCKIPSTQQ